MQVTRKTGKALTHTMLTSTLTLPAANPRSLRTGWSRSSMTMAMTMTIMAMPEDFNMPQLDIWYDFALEPK